MAINTAITSEANNPATDARQMATGYLTMPTTSLTAADFLLFDIGFTPRYVKFVNITDRIQIEWYEGMAADTCLKRVAAGDMSIETTNQGITICDDDTLGTANANGRAFKVSQNATLAAVTATDVHCWIATA